MAISPLVLVFLAVMLVGLGAGSILADVYLRLARPDWALATRRCESNSRLSGTVPSPTPPRK